MTGDDTLTIEIAGGVRMAVPADLRLMSTYVLLEQEDWFEDEIAFVRCLARPGGRMLDIGANLGVYGLSYAKAAGPDARVWAFEPTPHVAALARRSAIVSALPGFQLVESAIGATSGRQRLRVHENPELNQIGAGDGVDVAVRPLDELVAEHAIADVDFVKLDVEGFEDAVVASGGAFFSRQSPLVMLEIRTGRGACDLTALDRLQAQGYEAYQLVPELGVLAPLDRARIDTFLLNVFGCRPDRAAELAARSLLVGSADTTVEPATRARLEEWLVAMPAFAPHASAVSGLIARQPAGEPAVDMLCAYLAALDPARPAESRLAALRAAASLADRVQAATQSAVQIASAARILRGWGDRGVAANALLRLTPAFGARAEMRIDAPFMAPLRDYDSWASEHGLSAWLNAGIIEGIGAFARFSSYFLEPFGQPAANVLRVFGRATAPLERQRQLRRVKDGDQSALEPHALLRERRVDNLNPATWCGSTPGA